MNTTLNLRPELHLFSEAPIGDNAMAILNAKANAAIETHEEEEALHHTEAHQERLETYAHTHYKGNLFGMDTKDFLNCAILGKRGLGL